MATVSLSSIVSQLSELTQDKTFFKLSPIVYHLLEDIAYNLRTYDQLGNYDKLRYELEDSNPEVVVKALNKFSELKEKDSVIKKGLDTISNPQNLNTPDNLNQVKEILKKAEIDKVNQLFGLETLVNLGQIGFKFYTLKNCFDELKKIDHVIKDENLFKSIDDKFSQIELKMAEIEQLVEKSKFLTAKASLREVETMIKTTIKELNSISANLNGSKVKLEIFKKTAENETISNSFQSYSSLFRLINLERLSPLLSILSVLEFIGYSTLTSANAKIKSECEQKISQFVSLIKMAEEKQNKLEELEAQIRKYETRIFAAIEPN